LFKNVDTVLISGGEPTLRADLLDCVRAIHRALPEAKINIATNGNNPEYFIYVTQYLLELGIPLIVSTSIDGIGRTHDKIRGRGSWKKVKSLIYGLVDLRRSYPELQIGFGTVLTQENATEITKIVEFAEEWDLYYLIQWYNNSSYYSNLWDDETQADVELELSIVKKLDDQRFGMLKEKWIDWLNGKPIKFNCYALRDFLVIKANGDVVPCLTQWNWKIGNFKTDSPEKVWDGWLRQKALQTVSNCQGCLNSWGCYWSWESDGWPYVKYFISHPKLLLRKLRRK
jgi:MoaA/NifB/PqqE/SkfB family radical SAM enzyme